MCSYLTWPNGAREKGKLAEACYMYLTYGGCEREGTCHVYFTWLASGRGSILMYVESCNTDYAPFTFISIRKSADTNTSNVYLMQPTGGGGRGDSCVLVLYISIMR